jgi:hypothetical protein
LALGEGCATGGGLDDCRPGDGLAAGLGSIAALVSGVAVRVPLAAASADAIGDVEGAVVAAASDSMCRLQPWSATASTRAATGQVHHAFIGQR